MSRYIDAEKINFSSLTSPFDKARAEVIVMGQPTADVVEVKHGEWDNNGDFYQCSNCSNFTNYNYDYCPYCGAKMDKEAVDG